MFLSFFGVAIAMHYGAPPPSPDPFHVSATPPLAHAVQQPVTNIRDLELQDALKKIEHSKVLVRLYRGCRTGMQIFASAGGGSGVTTAIAWLSTANNPGWIKDASAYTTIITGGIALTSEVARRIFNSQVTQLNANLAQYLEHNPDEEFHKQIYFNLCKAVGTDKLAEELFSTTLKALLPSVHHVRNNPAPQQQQPVVIVSCPPPTPTSQ